MQLSSRGKNLHKTNPALFDELSNDSRKPTDNKVPFPETPDDASDIPLEVVQQHLASGPRSAGIGYVVDEDGHLKKGTRPYGGSRWDIDYKDKNEPDIYLCTFVCHLIMACLQERDRPLIKPSDKFSSGETLRSICPLMSS